MAGSSSKIAALAARAEPFAFAALRIVSGVLFAFHGSQKLFGAFGGLTKAVGSQAWVGGLIELTAGVLIALGLFTRCAAFLASGTMAVAYIQFHWKFAFAEAAWNPLVNKGELAAVYCFLFLFIAAHGSGRLSLDARRRS